MWSSVPAYCCNHTHFRGWCQLSGKYMIHTSRGWLNLCQSSYQSACLDKVGLFFIRCRAQKRNSTFCNCNQAMYTTIFVLMLAFTQQARYWPNAILELLKLISVDGSFFSPWHTLLHLILPYTEVLSWPGFHSCLCVQAHQPTCAHWHSFQWLFYALFEPLLHVTLPFVPQLPPAHAHGPLWSFLINVSMFKLSCCSIHTLPGLGRTWNLLNLPRGQ